jgi:hypothetical protein
LQRKHQTACQQLQVLHQLRTWLCLKLYETRSYRLKLPCTLQQPLQQHQPPGY